MGSSVDDFFTDIEERTDAGRTLPNWNGELYLEVSGSLAKSLERCSFFFTYFWFSFTEGHTQVTVRINVAFQVDY